jgi:thiamine-phosphate pyrophosphorylase
LAKTKTIPRGLYAITDEALIPEGKLEAAVARAVAGGAVVIQYRSKNPDRMRQRREAQTLVELCTPLGVPLIINDDVALARESGAAGVHLGREDEAIATARAALGPDAIIGVSCYNRFEHALAAQAAGADYIAFGSFFTSATKPAAVRAEPALLERARRELRVPAVAIGGITPENGAQLVRAGAHMLAVISGLFGTADTTAAARRYAALFDTSIN